MLISQVKALLNRVRSKHRRDKNKGKRVPYPKRDIKEIRLYIEEMEHSGKGRCPVEVCFLGGAQTRGGGLQSAASGDLNFI
jgi:hypothetical protein